MFANGSVCQLSRNNAGKQFTEIHASGSLGNSLFLLMKAMVTRYWLFHGLHFSSDVLSLGNGV